MKNTITIPHNQLYSASVPERGSMPNANFLDQDVTRSQVQVANKRDKMSPLAEIERDASAQGIVSRGLTNVAEGESLNIAGQASIAKFDSKVRL